MRFLALLTDAFGGRGGIAQYNRDFLTALLDCKLASRIEIVVRHAPDPVCGPAGIVQRAPHGKLGYALAALCALFSPAPDVVFCGHLHLAPLAAAIARLKRAKLVVQTHGIEAWRRPSRFEGAAIEASDLVLCVSRYTRGAVLSWARIPPERVLVLPNTVGESFTPGDGSALRTALGLDGKRVLLTVGRIDSRERYKGHDRVVDAMPALLARGHDVAYVIVGEGDDRQRLEERAAERGVADRLRFTGTLSFPDLVLAYRMADLFVMPSTGEGFGIAYLEAMACGVPALGLAIAGACDALAESGLGTILSQEELSVAIARLLEAPPLDPAALATMTRARFGRETFRSQLRAGLHRLREPS
jgi:phosphatidyl-myo-inositol dimannoside synthase